MAVVDHLEEAKGQLEAGCSFLDEGQGWEGDARSRVEIAAVHAQIAQVEETKRLADQLEAFSGDLSALNVAVHGHVTSGSP